MRHQIQNMFLTEYCPHIALVRHSESTESVGDVGGPKARWKHFSVVAIAGILFGEMAAAIVSKSELVPTATIAVQPTETYVAPPISKHGVSVWTIKRSDVDGADLSELNRRQNRNRRPEALVTVLRERAEPQTELVTETRTPVTVTYATK